MNGLMLAGLYSLISAGVTLIFGVLHIINFAQGAFLMLGAYLLYYVPVSYTHLTLPTKA